MLIKGRPNWFTVNGKSDHTTKVGFNFWMTDVFNVLKPNVVENKIDKLKGTHFRISKILTTENCKKLIRPNERDRIKLRKFYM